ncbi:MAG TPA: hypothetical protein VFH88_10255 [Candidatus Krumholzibacteria bacterium]|nr:hypothetical protein [Candidatus Krumholzibacteria bacterium]
MKNSLLTLFLLAVFATPAVAQYPSRSASAGGSESSGGWHRLKGIGPGHAAVVTLGDGTLRGGWVAGVDDQVLHLQSAGQTFDLAPQDIATVRVKRSDRTLLYSAIGYIVTATVATIVVYNDSDHEKKDLVIVFGVAGIPGGLLGALVGDRTSGDVEIVP